MDEGTIYSYSADSAALYGTLDRLPGRKNITAGSMKKIYDWDSGVYLGEIEEVEETYDVIGNMNEFQLTIGETTFGGVPQLTQGQQGAIMDYGNLIWTTLQRAKTVPQAISVMSSLVSRYGYASEGESFTLTGVCLLVLLPVSLLTVVSKDQKLLEQDSSISPLILAFNP